MKYVLIDKPNKYIPFAIRIELYENIYTNWRRTCDYDALGDVVHFLIIYGVQIQSISTRVMISENGARIMQKDSKTIQIQSEWMCDYFSMPFKNDEENEGKNETIDIYELRITEQTKQ